MKYKWIDEIIKYDGTQLKPLRNYLKYGLLGDSVIAWIGPCHVSFDHMLDGEDLLARSVICGDEMLHFTFEIFHQNLATGVFLQRLFASLCQQQIESESSQKIDRRGDDLFWQNKKLSISIAVPTIHSTLVHFALNIKNSGTPVPTCSLEELKVDAKKFANQIMEKISDEYKDILEATVKVKSVTH